MSDLFAEPRVQLAASAFLLRGFALPGQDALRAALLALLPSARFRHMSTPGGRSMAVSMSNCGERGWVSDQSGYRYTTHDPVSGAPWPAMPPELRSLAVAAALEAGFEGFNPDACLVNSYKPGAALGVHQDRDEKDFTQPIVSVSLGLPAVFQFGGPSRSARLHAIPLEHGDVVVWGGSSRLNFHGVKALADGDHPFCGGRRINLTFRKSQ